MVSNGLEFETLSNCIVQATHNKVIGFITAHSLLALVRLSSSPCYGNMIGI